MKLEPKLIGEIAGNFIIPPYQRGYRWKHEQVQKLLEDIWENKEKNYCLQPVVVSKKDNGSFELIDGQQRLTTLFLILRYMGQSVPAVKINFSIEYETRHRSKDFLLTLDPEEADHNVDFWHIYNAHLTIKKWFQNNGDELLTAINLYKYFNENVKIIWYEAQEKDPINLFTRLNIGKIPLTNAELVKALLLSRDDNGLNEEKQHEIASGWDSIEKELHNSSLWAFLTNEKNHGKYDTRIELLFDMISNKRDDEKEDFYTFDYFSKSIRAKSKTTVWENIQSSFLVLKEWFDNRDDYHKIGYLVATGEKLRVLYQDSLHKTKTQFRASLNDKIRSKLNLSKEKILELAYNKDNGKIEDLLFLFNVETVRLLKDSFDRYPYEAHRRKSWSLEHIHAQHSEGLNKKEQQLEWLSLHKKSLLEVKKIYAGDKDIDAIIKDIDAHAADITRETFERIFRDTISVLSEDNSGEYTHGISNLALLCNKDNAALNNSTFDVKRNIILDKDKKGDYIPICTRRVFLKYYTESENHQLFFWGEHDRNAYTDAMIEKLKPYLIQNDKSE